MSWFCFSQRYSICVSSTCWDLVYLFKAGPLFKKCLKQEHHTVQSSACCLGLPPRLQWDSSRTGLGHSRMGRLVLWGGSVHVSWPAAPSLFQGHVNAHLHCWLFVWADGHYSCSVLNVCSDVLSSMKTFLAFQVGIDFSSHLLYLTRFAFNLWPDLFPLMTIQFLIPEMGVSFIVKWATR